MSASTNATTFPFGLSANGPTIRHGALLTTGNVFFVSSTESGRADDAMHGRQPATPFATLAYALNQCSEDIGDLVLVMEGHIETITSAGGVTFGTPGVQVVGLGVGENRPRLRLVGSTAASIAFAADNVRVDNVVIDATQLDAIVNAVTVNAADCTLRDCDLYLGGALAQAVLGIVTTTNADRLRIEDCTFWGSADLGPTAFVQLVGTPTGIALVDCRMVGTAAEALIWNDTGSVATNLLIQDCTLRTLGGTAAIKLESAVTGQIRDVALAGTDLASLYDPGACASVTVLGYDETVTDGQAVPLPANGTSLAAGRSVYDELLGAAVNAGRLNSFVVTADFTSATWNTVARHGIAVVSGLCRVRIVPVCTSSLTSGGAPTMQMGDTDDTTAMILSTDPLSILTDTLWLSISPKKNQMYLGLLDQLANDTTLGYETFIAALTAGAIAFHVFWEPLSDGASVTAGAGATF